MLLFFITGCEGDTGLLLFLVTDSSLSSCGGTAAEGLAVYTLRGLNKVDEFDDILGNEGGVVASSSILTSVGTILFIGLFLMITSIHRQHINMTQQILVELTFGNSPQLAAVITKRFAATFGICGSTTTT